MDDGARTRDSQNHNLELYQLSYIHRNSLNLPHTGRMRIEERGGHPRNGARATPASNARAHGGRMNMELTVVEVCLAG